MDFIDLPSFSNFDRWLLTLDEPLQATVLSFPDFHSQGSQDESRRSRVESLASEDTDDFHKLLLTYLVAPMSSHVESAALAELFTQFWAATTIVELRDTAETKKMMYIVSDQIPKAEMSEQAGYEYPTR